MKKLTAINCEIEFPDNVLDRISNYKSSLFLFLLLCMAISVADAQPKCKVEYYSTENGLSHQRVTTMLKDREGFMWFGSWDGINRFDGHSFLSYKSSPGDRSQFGNDRIDQIVEDQSGYLWLEAYDKQVYRFDKKTGEFLSLSNILREEAKPKFAFRKILGAMNGVVWLEAVEGGIFCVPQKDVQKLSIVNYKKDAAPGYELPSNAINFFHEDQEHGVWIGTPDGLCYLTKNSDGGYANSKYLPAGIFHGKSITAFAEDGAKLYFITSDGNLITYNKQLRIFTTKLIAAGRLNGLVRSKTADVLYITSGSGELITFHLQDQQITKTLYSKVEQLLSLYEDKSGVLWIEPAVSGAIRFDPVNRAFQYFSQKNEKGFSDIGNRFRVLEDNNGTIWINMKRGGFGYYNVTSQSVDNYVQTPDASGFRLPSLVYSINYDTTGLLWFTTYEKELVKLILQRNDFKQQLLVEQGGTTQDNEVRGIMYDHKSRLWVGSKNGQVQVFQNEVRLKGLFDNEPVDGIGLVYSMLQDSRGNIWLGTKGNGLYKASPLNQSATKYHLTHLLPDRSNTGALPCNEIYALIEDRQGSIWIGSYDKGLVLVKEDPAGISFITQGPAFKNYPKAAFQKIRHLELDHQGNLWIASTDGLVLLNVSDRRSSAYACKTYSKIPGDKESLGNNDIQFICRDAKSRMWLGTSGGGFCKAISDRPFESMRFKNFTTREGMPNDYVLSCAEDKTGNLWIATENGLTRFSPETNLFRNYDSYDGLPKASFSEAAVSIRTVDGQLVFGTSRGYLLLDPIGIRNNRIAANIVFTNLQVNNEDIAPGMKEVALKKNVNYEYGLSLHYDQNIISIDYAILDHRAGNTQAFAYRLVGFDSTWHNDRQLRRATYTNLPPGDYLFEVKSMSGDLYTSTPYKRLAITILPPPWKTWWAYLLYIVFIGIVFFFIRKYTIAMIRLRNKIAVEQKLAALKLNFFTNISHELRTPLTLIVNPLDQLYRKEKLSAEGAAYVEVARKNANRMVRFINQLLDLRKIQSDKASLRISRVEMLMFVKKISDHFAEAARSKRIKLDISCSRKEVLAWVDAEKLDVVVYNLLGNAIKFSPEGKAIRIMIETFETAGEFSIAVCDEGPGVSGEKLENIFELFNVGDLTAEREVKGSGIGLALSRELVNLHGGTIRATNNEAGGLCVTIQMKSGVEHYKQDVSFIDLPKTPMAEETPIGQQILPVAFSTTTDNQEAPLVLLVEDNEELRSFIRGQLGEYYRVETACNGEEGFEKALTLLPDLILSDIMMPVMDGIAMLDKVKNDMNTSHIPVVLLSARYSVESQIEGLKYGADYYITKPFNNEFLIASIDNLIRQRRKLFDALVKKKKNPELGPEPIVVTSKDELFLKEVISVVEHKMTETEFNIDAVAEDMLMSRTTFYKKFKSLTGLTPADFVKSMRLQRAKQYLDAGGNNIAEVAYLSGFSNPKYFSTCFKEKYHVSPSDYQKAKA